MVMWIILGVTVIMGVVASVTEKRSGIGRVARVWLILYLIGWVVYWVHRLGGF